MLERIDLNLRAMRIGITLTLLTFAFGFGLGAVFGIAEDTLKGGLRTSGEEVLESIYHGDSGKMDAVVSKSWTYYKRAHLHAGAMAAAALSMILLLAMTDGRYGLKRLVSMMLGAGGLGYSVFWLLAGCRAPGLGSTGLAKQSLEWLAKPSAGLFILGMLCTLLIFMLSAYGRKR